MKKNIKLLISSLGLAFIMSVGTFSNLIFANSNSLSSNILTTNNSRYLQDNIVSSETRTDYAEYGKAVADTTITDLSTYDSAYEDNNICPISTDEGSIGMPDDSSKSNYHKTLALTDYSGLLLWSSNLTQNKLLQDYYQKQSGDQTKTFDLSGYTIKHYVYLENDNALIVLFGDSNSQNEVIFAIDYSSGDIIVPTSGANIDKDGTIFASAIDGAKMLYINSAGQIIASSGGTYSEYSTKTNIHSFSKTSGFALVNTIASSTDMVYLNNTTDKSILINIVAGQNGINFAIFIDSTTLENKTYAVSNSFTYNSGRLILDGTVGNGFYYRVVCVNDNLYESSKSEKTTFEDVFYSTSSETVNMPTFDGIFKRAYSVPTTDGTSKLALWCYSSLAQYSQMDTITFTPESTTTAATNSAIKGSFTNAQYKLSLLNDKTHSFNKGVTLDNSVNIGVGMWVTKSVDYDSKSETFVFSQSAKATVNSVDKYYVDTRVVHLDSATNEYKVGFETEDSNGQSSEEKISLIHGQIDSTNTESTTYADSANNKVYYLGSHAKNDTTYGFKEIDVSSTNDLSISDAPSTYNYTLSTIDDSNLSNENMINKKMPSTFTESDLASLVTVNTNVSTKDTFTTSASSIKANDNEGELSFDLTVIHTTPIPSLPNPSFSKNYDLTDLYSLNKSFSPLKDSSDNKVLAYINGKKASSISTQDVLNNLIDKSKLKDSSGAEITLIDKEISLTPNDEKGTLDVSINLSNLTLSSLPYGFSKAASNKLSTTYNGFKIPTIDTSSQVLDLISIKVCLIIISIIVLIILAILIYLVSRNIKRDKSKYK